MERRTTRTRLLMASLGIFAGSLLGDAVIAEAPHPLRRWVKRHPLPRDGARPSPRMGYEGSYGYDPRSRLLVRYGGHNQGGGGEQNSEVWTYDLERDAWNLKEPDDAPPGVCCAQQNVFAPGIRRFVRFPAFSASHGWQSRREVYLRNSSVWVYDLARNTWRNRRPLPAPRVRPLRGAAHDPHHGVVVIHGGEGASHGTVIYDPYANRWHRPEPDPSPPRGISQPGFTYDEAHRVFVLFGSQFQSDPRTWVYRLRENSWRVLDVAGHPPAEKTSPVLAADSRSGIVLALVDTPEGNETWVLDVDEPAWRRLELESEPEKSGPRNRVLTYLADRNLFVLENRTKTEQQIWTFRYAEAARRTPSPRDLEVTTGDSSALLEWRAPEGATGFRYHVERVRGPEVWKARFERVASSLEETRHEDRGVDRGALYHYRVIAADPEGEVSEPTAPVRAQPAVLEEVTVSIAGPRQVEVHWEKPAARDVSGFHVERAAVRVYSTDEIRRLRERYRETSDTAPGRIARIGPFRRLTRQPIAAGVYLDRAIDLERAGGSDDGSDDGSDGDEAAGGSPAASFESRIRPAEIHAAGKPYRFRVLAYRVVAVNRLGVEGGPSAPRFTYPSAVREVFAREEEGGKTRLRWRRHPEKGIRGYLVYRHDGRWDKDPIVRLTPTPLKRTEFLDETAGERTRRYEVVAVDALGQEGEPSRPVWSRREWRRFYVPYVGEWHQ